MHPSHRQIALKSSQTRHKPPSTAVLTGECTGWSPSDAGSYRLVRARAAHLSGMASSSSSSSPSEPFSRLERLLSIQELSEYLGVPVKTLYSWRAQRVGPRAVNVGRALRYPESAIIAWLEAQS